MPCRNRRRHGPTWRGDKGMYWTRMLVLAAAVTVPWMASAKVLEAGADKQYKQPSEAIAAAANGDTVRISGGQYFDCAVVAVDNLTIEGVGPDAVFTDKTCNGKALLVID